MAIDLHSIEFILIHKHTIRSFDKVLMLGRQSVYRDPSISEESFVERLSQLCTKYGIQIDSQSVLRELSESDWYSEPIFRLLGAKTIHSVDKSGYEGSTMQWDMNLPLHTSSLGTTRYDVVIDGGSLEHIFNFPQAVKNCMELIALGGTFIGFTIANNYCGHGLYQFSPELWFRIFSPENGFSLQNLVVRWGFEGSPFFEVQDPQKLGKRVEVSSLHSLPTYLIAKKDSECDIFARIPQQSDYSSIWQKHSVDSHDSEGGRGMELNLHPKSGVLATLCTKIMYAVERYSLKYRKFEGLRLLSRHE